MKRFSTNEEAQRKRKRTTSYQSKEHHSGYSPANAIPVGSDEESPTAASESVKRRSVSSEVSSSGRGSVFPYTKFTNDSFAVVNEALQDYARTIPQSSAERSLLIEGLPLHATFLDVSRILIENSAIENASQLYRIIMSSRSPGAAIVSISRLANLAEALRRLSTALIEWKDGRTYRLHVQSIASLPGRPVVEDEPEIMVISDDEALELLHAPKLRRMDETPGDRFSSLSIRDDSSDMDLESTTSDVHSKNLSVPPSPTPASSRAGSTTSGGVSYASTLSRGVSTSSSSANYTSPEPIAVLSTSKLSLKQPAVGVRSSSPSESEDEIDEIDEDDVPYVPYLAPAFPRSPSVPLPVRAAPHRQKTRAIQHPILASGGDSSDSSSDDSSSSSPSSARAEPGPSAFGVGPRSLSPTASEFVRLGSPLSETSMVDLTQYSSDEDDSMETPFPNHIRRRRIIRSPSRSAPSMDDGLPAEHSARLLKQARHRPRRILVPFESDKPLATVAMKSDVRFFPRKERFRIVGSLPEYKTDRVVEDAVVLRSGTGVIAYLKPDHLQIGLVSWDTHAHELTILPHAPHKPGRSGGLSCLSAGPSPRQFITGGTDCQLRLWTIKSRDLSATKSKSLLVGLPAKPSALLCEGSQVYAACGKQLLMMDIERPRAAPTKVSITTVHHIHHSPDPHQIILEVGDLYDQAHVFDHRTLIKPVLRLGYVSPEGRKQTKYFRGAPFDNHFFVRGFQDGTICIWDLRNLRNDAPPLCMKKFDEPAVHCATDENRLYVAAGLTMHSLRKSTLV